MKSPRMNVRALVMVGWVVAAAGCSSDDTPTAPNQPSFAAGNSELAGPSGLTAVASPPSRIDLAWTDNSNAESGFELHAAGAADGSFSSLAETGPDVTTAGFENVGYSVTFCYTVRAFAKAGQKKRKFSAFS